MKNIFAKVVLLAAILTIGTSAFSTSTNTSAAKDFPCLPGVPCLVR